MRKTIYGMLTGAAAGAGLLLAFFAFDLWRGPASSADWAERRSAAAACCLLGWLAGSLRDAARAERLGGAVRVIIGLGLGAISGLFCARVANWPAAGDRSVLYLAAGVLSGAVLLKATANRRPSGERRPLRRRRQFSLRGMLIAIALIGIALALLPSSAMRRWRLSSELVRRGVQLRYDDRTTSSWRFLLGDSARPLFDDIESAELRGSAGDEELALLALRGGARYLRLNGPRVTDAGIGSLRSFKRLAHLRLGGSSVTDGGLKNLHNLTSVQFLDLNSTGITSRGVAELFGLRRLSRLGLAGCKVDDSALAALAKLPVALDFAWLDVSYTAVTDTGLSHLVGLTRLTNLSLNGTAISDDGLAHLSSLVELRQLQLSGTAITDAGLEHLRPLKQLDWLRLDGTQMTGTGLGALRDLPKLSQLNLSYTPLGDAAMEEIGRLGQLVSLDLTAVPITDAGLASLGGLTKLEALTLDGARITDAGLASLAGLTKLEVLTLDGTGITDAGLKSLEGMAKLNVLHVRRTAVTMRGIQRLQAVQYEAKLRVADDPIAGAPPVLTVVP